jgi:hypothetical protein|tara:strand:+ start:839 stop:2347 length:1509 start_codon:yes stop_codon:yes gene_type:complete
MATPSGLTATAINPAGLTPENLAKYEEALKASMDALQARYENPNWFNVAAGFLKPQLGGFAASLGSAGAALGDWEEKRRANELPVAQMRAQLGLVGMQQEQKNQADARYAQAMARGGFTEADVAYIAARDKEKGLQAAEAFDRTKGTKTAQGVRAEVLSNAIANRPSSVSGQQIANTPNFSAFNGDVKFGAPSGAAPAPVVATPAPVPGAAPPVLGAPPVPPVDFQVPNVEGGLTPTQKSEADKAQNIKGLEFRNELANQVAQLPVRSANLSTAYETLNDPNVQRVLGRTKTGSVSAILQAGLTSDTAPDAVRRIVSLLVNPDTISEIKPIKDAKGNTVPGGSVREQVASLNEKIGMLARTAAAEQLNVNQIMKNPTDYARSAERNLAINLEDTARSNQRTIATTLHEMSKTTRLHDIAQRLSNKNLGYPELIAHPESQKAQEAWAKEHKLLAETPLREKLPKELQFPFRTIAPAAPGASAPVSSIVQQLRAAQAARAAAAP